MTTDSHEPASDLTAGQKSAFAEAAYAELTSLEPPLDSAPAAMPRTPRRSRLWPVLRETLLSVAIVAVIFVGTREVAQGREVLGPSMQPTFHQGQRIFITKYLVGSPAHGDVVVFKPPVQSPDDYIKRVIGVPGDHVVVAHGTVSVNGQALSESYVHGQTTTCGGQYCDVTLGANQYYVLGDNRGNSADSRFWGPVSGDNIKGKAWLRFYPLDEFKFAP
ncbi:MAG TPA: signal peptidase I [Dehalococcoidia bacterium]|nr:signal peptidase I [Dehalococcoidia bacterium]